MVIGMHGRQHLLQAQLAMGGARVQAKRMGQRLVDGKPVVGHVPEPRPHDRAGGKRHFHPLGVAPAVLVCGIGNVQRGLAGKVGRAQAG